MRDGRRETKQIKRAGLLALALVATTQLVGCQTDAGATGGGSYRDGASWTALSDYDGAADRAREFQESGAPSGGGPYVGMRIDGDGARVSFDAPNDPVDDALEAYERLQASRPRSLDGLPGGDQAGE